MTTHLRNLVFVTMFVAFAGCAGTARGCSSWWAESAGADWIVVQYNGLGEPFRCWALEGVSVANEEGSDGIYWRNPDGHLIHLSGHYNRIQVSDGNWDSAFAEIGLTRDVCSEIQRTVLTSPWIPDVDPE